MSSRTCRTDSSKIAGFQDCRIAGSEKDEMTHEFLRGGFLGTLVLLLGACSTNAQQPRTMSPGDVVATVGTVSITLEQVDEKALQEQAGNFGSLKLSQAIYEARR